MAIFSGNPSHFDFLSEHYLVNSVRYGDVDISEFPQLYMGPPLAIFNFPPPTDIHLITSFPQFQDVSFKVLEPISPNVWCYIYVSLLTLTLAVFLVLFVYRQVMPQYCHLKEHDPTQVWLRIIGGATEAFYGQFFKFGVAGSLLMLVFELVSYSITTVYNANLRAFIIGEIPDFIPNKYSDIAVNRHLVIFSDHGLSFLVNSGKHLDN